MAGRELHWIDYIEGRGKSLSHYADLLAIKAKVGGFSYRAHLLPHDVEVKELATGHSRKHELNTLLREPVITVPNHSTEDGITATRGCLGVSWFDEECTRKGLARLRSYRKGKSGHCGSLLRRGRGYCGRVSDGLRRFANDIGWVYVIKRGRRAFASAASGLDMKWLRDWVCHRMGWETHDEAYARIWAQMEFRYPRKTRAQREEERRRADEAYEALRKRLDAGGEYERGMEGLQ